MRKYKNIIIITVFSLFFVGCKDNVSNKNVEITARPVYNEIKLKEKANQALSYCKKKGMNTQYCILADMSLHSGVYRLFVWDFKNNKIIKKSLVSHGCCEKPWGSDFSKKEVKFSNTPNSHCSSKGKYKIGKRGYSNWGIHINYKLHGLETTNSKAYKRVIVLHSWKKVTDKELFPKGTPEGWGCPAVSNSMMRYLDSKLKKKQKPVLFWIYN